MLLGSWASAFSIGSTQNQESSWILVMLEYWDTSGLSKKHAVPRHLENHRSITVSWAETKIKDCIQVQGHSQAAGARQGQGILGRLGVWSRITLLSFRTQGLLLLSPLILHSLMSLSTSCLHMAPLGEGHSPVSTLRRADGSHLVSYPRSQGQAEDCHCHQRSLSLSLLSQS